MVWHAVHPIAAYICRLNLRHNFHAASRNLLFPHTRVHVTLIKASCYALSSSFFFLIFIKCVLLLLQVWYFQMHIIIIPTGTEFVPSFAASEKSPSANCCQRRRCMSSKDLNSTQKLVLNQSRIHKRSPASSGLRNWPSETVLDY